jgi:hypothetical protein
MLHNVSRLTPVAAANTDQNKNSKFLRRKRSEAKILFSFEKIAQAQAQQ